MTGNSDAIFLLNNFFKKSSVAFLLSFLCLFFTGVSCKGKKDSSRTSTTQDNRKKGKLTDEEQVKFKSFFLNAVRQKSLGNLELAEEQFREALKIDPSNPAAQYEIAYIYRNNGLYDEALNYSRQAAQGDPKNEWYQLLYIDCLHSKKFYAEAAEAYEKLIQQYPNRRDYYEQLAKEYAYAGNYSKALKTYDAIGDRFGKSAEIYLAKIRILKQQKKISETEEELKKLIEQYPKESNYYTYLAELYQDTKQDEKAMEIYRKLTQIDPENPYVHLALADYYRSRQNDSAFLREVKVAFKSPDLAIDQKVMMLISFFSVSDEYPQYRKDGIELCEIVVNVHPDDPKAYAVYGDYLYRDKRLEDARKAYLEVIRREEGKFAVWEKLMRIDAELYDFVSLEKHSAQVIELFPANPWPLYYSGIAKVQLKKYKDGIDQLLEAKEYVVDDNDLLTQIFSRLGDAYFYMKEYEKSDKAFEDALKLSPESPQVLNNYAYFLSLRKFNLSRAEKLSARANELDNKNHQYMDTYARILYQQGKLDMALEWIEKAVAGGGEKNGVILEHYGDILFKLNQPERAFQYWKKSKETGRHSEFLDKKINEKKLYE